MPPPPVNLYDAKTHLSSLGDRAASGTAVVIGRAGKPVARLTRLAPPKRRIRFGVLKGKLRIATDFDAPLPDDVLADFEGR
jgi:antitoxin (DNA-binding transcriptional repressor) of toxin-antitoxin stability system